MVFLHKGRAEGGNGNDATINTGREEGGNRNVVPLKGRSNVGTRKRRRKTMIMMRERRKKKEGMGMVFLPKGRGEGRL